MEFISSLSPYVFILFTREIFQMLLPAYESLGARGRSIS